MAEPNENAIPSGLKQAVMDTFQVQVGIQTKIASIVAESADSQSNQTPIDCLSVLGIRCSQYTGSLAIGFPTDTFLKIIEKMIGEKHTTINNENADACSELLNIIYAGARVKINQSGFDFQPAIPTTIRGQNLSITLGNTAQILKFFCESECGPFVVAFHLKKSKT